MKMTQPKKRRVDQGRLSPRKVVAYGNLAVGAILLVCVLGSFLFPDMYINSFIEIVDHTRITSGILEEATFDISVASGHATGNVRAAYRDLYCYLS
jgi:hypothetical protein